MNRNYEDVRGISIINPDRVEREYYNYCIDYAIDHGFNHIQITGPIHDFQRGNLDGMMYYKKYSEFNGEKDKEYVDNCLDVVNEGLKKSHAAGIKTFMWHHELDMPRDFGKNYPETLNANGDIEVSHPTVLDFLENKVKDFFGEYPLMDGIVITLHETKIPLLKLKNQKLGKIERVRLVIETLFKACDALGKEIMVRPFASLQEDQIAIVRSVENISPKILLMDKWTKFDWSLSLPDNDFFEEFKTNPFFVETDIFGEYYGKGRLPIMFREHIEHKVEYCNKYEHSGFVSRIDRNYQNAFGSVNEVNLRVMHAITAGLDVDAAVDGFFREFYGEAGPRVKKIMEKTEENQKKIFYMQGYYYTQGSYFPEVNHAKNHFYFEIMKEDYDIASPEWFIPVGWKRTSIEDILKEKEEAAVEAAEMLREIEELKPEIEKERYDALWLKFKNLDYVAKIWRELTYVFYNYVKYFETRDESFEAKLMKNLDEIDRLHREGRAELGEPFYNYFGARGFTQHAGEFGGDFTKALRLNLECEKRLTRELEAENLTDFIACGGPMESHRLMKEVNFSDTVFIGDDFCRIAGNRGGANWSRINSHGWFSYELKVKPNTENELVFNFASSTDTLRAYVNIDGEIYEINEKIEGRRDFAFKYSAKDSDKVRVRIDRIDANTPYLFTIKVK